MESGEPKVSVVIPLFNKGAYIHETIESVIAQTMPQWELLVVDNGSSDGGPDIVKTFKDSRIRLLGCRVQGVCSARNMGVCQGSGTWVLFLDADDVLDPTHLQNLLEIGGNDENCELVTGGWQEFQVDEPDLRTAKTPAGSRSNPCNVAETAIAFAPWAVHAALVRRKVLVHPFLWPVEMNTYLSEDTVFWFRLLTRYKVVYSDTFGALYRKATETSRDEYWNSPKWLKGMQAVTRSNLKFLSDYGLPLTAGHCENLMRLYSSIFLLGRRNRDRNTAATAIELARYWLRECSKRGGCHSLPLLVRRFLGLRIFLPLAYWREQMSGTSSNVNF